MKKIAILHTTSATIAALTPLCDELMPRTKIVNLLDDSILDQLIEDPQSISTIYGRLLGYASNAKAVGAEAALLACSSIGGFADFCGDRLGIPVLRIDEPMAREAAEMGKPIWLLATLETTLTPSLDLLRRFVSAPIRHSVLSGAFEHLKAGRRAQYEAEILQGVAQALDAGCTVVLAQASMAGALSGISQDDRHRVLTSPRSGIRALAAIASKNNDHGEAVN